MNKVFANANVDQFQKLYDQYIASSKNIDFSNSYESKDYFDKIISSISSELNIIKKEKPGIKTLALWSHLINQYYFYGDSDVNEKFISDTEYFILHYEKIFASELHKVGDLSIKIASLYLHNLPTGHNKTLSEKTNNNDQINLINKRNEKLESLIQQAINYYDKSSRYKFFFSSEFDAFKLYESKEESILRYFEILNEYLHPRLLLSQIYFNIKDYENFLKTQNTTQNIIFNLPKKYFLPLYPLTSKDINFIFGYQKNYQLYSYIFSDKEYISRMKQISLFCNSNNFKDELSYCKNINFTFADYYYRKREDDLALHYYEKAFYDKNTSNINKIEIANAIMSLSPREEKNKIKLQEMYADVHDEVERLMPVMTGSRLDTILGGLLNSFHIRYAENLNNANADNVGAHLKKGLQILQERDIDNSHHYYVLFEMMIEAFTDNEIKDLDKLINIEKRFLALDLDYNESEKIYILSQDVFFIYQKLLYRMSRYYARKQDIVNANFYADKGGKFGKDHFYFSTKGTICLYHSDKNCRIKYKKAEIKDNEINLKDPEKQSLNYQLILRQNLFYNYADLASLSPHTLNNNNLESELFNSNLAFENLLYLVGKQKEAFLLTNSEYLKILFENSSNRNRLQRYLYSIYSSQLPITSDLGLNIEYQKDREYDKFFFYFTKELEEKKLWNLTKPKIKVKSVREDSLFHDLGIKKNEYLINVNGYDVDSVNLNDLDFFVSGDALPSLLKKESNILYFVTEDQLDKPILSTKGTEYLLWPRRIEFDSADYESYLNLSNKVNYNTYNNAFKLTQMLLYTDASESINRLYDRNFAKNPKLVKERLKIKSTIEKINNEMISIGWTLDSDAEKNYKKEIESLTEDLLSIESKMTDLDIELSNKSYQEIYELKDVINMIKDDEALIINFEVFSSYYQWIILNDGTVKFNKILPNKIIDLESFTFIDTGIETFRQAIEDKKNNIQSKLNIDAISRNLHNMLISPIEDIIGDKKNKIFLSYGDLAKIPLSVLQFYSSEEKFRDDSIYTNIVSLVSLDLRRSSQIMNEEKMKYLGIGNPRFQEKSLLNKYVKNNDFLNMIESIFRDSAIADRNILKIQNPLPETELEVTEISSNFIEANTKILLQEHATEKKIKSMDLTPYDIVHFATHSIPSVGKNEPGLSLSLPDKSTLIDDGVLTPSEIVDLNLNAKLVILSACNTANGKNTDSAILSGLAQSFLYAGAENMIVSHCPVERNSTVLLMTSFVNYWLKEKMDPAEALKHAKIDLRNIPEYNHPIYWAGFSYYGL